MQTAVTCPLEAAHQGEVSTAVALVLIRAVLLQDLSMHKEEIHSKLVAIMRERLATNLKQLPLIATSWAGSPPPPSLPSTPSNFAQTNAKQLRILSQVWCLLPMGQ